MRVSSGGPVASILKTSRFIGGYYKKIYPKEGGYMGVWQIGVKDTSQPIDNPTTDRRVLRWKNGVLCYRFSYGYYVYKDGEYYFVFIEYRWYPSSY